MKPSSCEPITTLCIERLHLSSELYRVPEDNPKLQKFRNGVHLLSGIAHAGISQMPQGLKGTSDLLDEPILAIELDAILSGFLKQLTPKSLESEVLSRVQQSARKRILQAWKQHKETHSGPLPDMGVADPPLIEPSEVEALARSVLDDLSHGAATEESIVSRIARLGEVKGVKGLTKSVFFLLAVLCTHESTKQNVIWLEKNQAHPRGMRPYEFSAEGALEDHRRLDRFIRVTQYALTRVYLSLYEIAASDKPEAGEAFGWLEYASGGDARLILDDVELVRGGRSPFVAWLADALRTNHAETVARTHIAALAHSMELQYEVVDGRPFPHASTSEPLWNRLSAYPLRLPDGQIVTRERREIQEETMRLLAALQANAYADSVEATHAISAASSLVGDPRVDAQSLLDWVQSLDGERRSFSEEQFVRFLQEANAFVLVTIRLHLDRRMMIAREHRKDLREKLASSFDIAVIETKSNTVVEVIEIKQTTCPRQASDLGGILRQATSKLDGEFSPLLGTAVPAFHLQFSPGAPAVLRHISARRTLIIQFPWEWDQVQYKRGSLTFVVHHNGRVEKWRTNERPGKGSSPWPGEPIFEHSQAPSSST